MRAPDQMETSEPSEMDWASIEAEFAPSLTNSGTNGGEVPGGGTTIFNRPKRPGRR